MNKLQEAKALGGLVAISLKDLDSLPVVESGGMADFEQLSCGFPNAPDAEIADTDIDQLAHYLGCDAEHAAVIRQCHAGLLRADLEAGSGSWGICNTDAYPAHHSVQYGVDVDSFPSHYHRRATDAEIRELSIEKSPWWKWSVEEVMDRFNGKTILDLCLLVGVEETYRLTGNAHIRVDSKPRNGIWIRSRAIPGSTIGIGWFPGAGCSSLVEFHIDSTWNPSLQPRIGLFGHECGHCNNLPHTFSGQSVHKGVMSYTSKYPYEGYSTGDATQGFTLPRDPSWRLLERFYEPRPAPDRKKPQPPPPPGKGTIYGEQVDGKIVIRGEFTVPPSTQQQTFIVTPVAGKPGEFVPIPKPVV